MRFPASTFLCGDKAVRIEAIAPRDGVKRPAILLVHGAAGIHGERAYLMNFAALAAQHDWAVFLVSYMDSTGHMSANEAEIRMHFHQWVNTLKCAVDQIVTNTNVDRERIGCFGYSLGGFLALALGASDSRIGAVVEVAGGLDAEYSDEVLRLPVTLILHGRRDQRVPIGNALRAARLLKTYHVPFEMKIYQNEGHLLSERAYGDAMERAATFFEKHLNVPHAA